MSLYKLLKLAEKSYFCAEASGVLLEKLPLRTVFWSISQTSVSPA